MGKKLVINGRFTVQVVRAGETISVGEGQPFEFTEAEVSQILRAKGDAALRDPRDENIGVRASTSSKSAPGIKDDSAESKTTKRKAPAKQSVKADDEEL